MSKAEFMRELERLLQNIPENERVEALNYYEEYFSDAGEENEQKVLEELESPEKVADNIKDGLRANMDYRDTTPGNGQNSAWHSGAAYQNGTSYQGSTIYQGNTFYQSPPKASAEKEEMPAWAIVLIVIACIIFSPVLLGVAGSLLGVLVGVLATCFFGFFGLVIGFGAGGVGCFVAGVAVLVSGFAVIAHLPFAGMAMIGAAFLCLAIGMLCIMFTVWLLGWALPAICRGISWLWKKITKRGRN